jgi:hypothetical protein
MKLTYASTVNQWFDGYPRILSVTCGPNITELGGPWVDGSNLTVFQTPLSKTHIGSYIDGAILPEYKMRYSDNAQETGWTAFLIVSGYGYFFELDTGDYMWLNIDRSFELISSYNDKHLVFSTNELLYTNIPRETPIVPPYVPPTVPPPPIVPPPPTTGGGGGGTAFNPSSPAVHDALGAEFYQRIRASVPSTSYNPFPVYSRFSPVTVSKSAMSSAGFTEESLATFSEFDARTWVDRYNVRFYKAGSAMAIYVVFGHTAYDIGQEEPPFVVDYVFSWTGLAYRGVNYLPTIWNML